MMVFILFYLALNSSDYTGYDSMLIKMVEHLKVQLTINAKWNYSIIAAVWSVFLVVKQHI